MFRKVLALVSTLVAFWACNVQAEQILRWEQMNEDGFGDVHNSETWPLAVFGDYVYVGTESYWETAGGESHSTGGQLWRVSEDNDWEQVNEDGFGDVNNSMIWPGTVFGGYLYVGCQSIYYTGGGIWRSQTGDPSSWEQVVTDGFGDATNVWVIPWVVFDGYLYAGTSKERIAEGSCEVWRSPDGTTWEQVNTDGFGDPNNSEEPIYMSVFGDYLYIGTYNASTVDTLTPTFEWLNLSIPVDGYSVQIDDMNHNKVYDVYDLPDGTTSHTIPGGYLSWETSYYWLVSASGANGSEALTIHDTFTTISQPP